MEVKWLPLVGYESTHEISEYGEVRRTTDARSQKAGYVLSHQIDRYGYHRVGLMKNKRVYMFAVHRLVALTFISEMPEGKEVNHKDGNKHNNHYSNLEYITHKENCQHSFDVLGRVAAKGEDCNSSKLTDANILEIRRLSNEGLSQRSIGDLLGVSHVTIGHVLRGRTWKHV